MNRSCVHVNIHCNVWNTLKA